VIATAICAAGAGLWLVIPKNTPGFAIVLIAVLCGVALFVSVLFRSPIAWNFDGFLGYVGNNQGIRFTAFQAQGFNRSRREIRSIQGWFVSNIDSSVSGDLQFVVDGNLVPPPATMGIPPRATFLIAIPLCDVAKGDYLTEQDFRRKWSTFRFVVNF